MQPESSSSQFVIRRRDFLRRVYHLEVLGNGYFLEGYGNNMRIFLWEKTLWKLNSAEVYTKLQIPLSDPVNQIENLKHMLCFCPASMRWKHAQRVLVSISKPNDPTHVTAKVPLALDELLLSHSTRTFCLNLVRGAFAGTGSKIALGIGGAVFTPAHFNLAPKIFKLYLDQLSKYNLVKYAVFNEQEYAIKFAFSLVHFAPTHAPHFFKELFFEPAEIC
ncbi:hypothetical protein H7F15_01390 [Pontibacter sp. Tf4]|uniref:hypothetical protein n=1 Tax=Pontibacter sp. Tf4 TaxID=2761620 RepID=UPI00162AB9E2|nr:hypothetical protein [Pontibacter sp. Tf4]MBB6609679.1 hypothetical protein [Pontibacter sp. Tf4]